MMTALAAEDPAVTASRRYAAPPWSGTPCACLFRPAPSIGSSPPRCSSTFPRIARRHLRAGPGAASGGNDGGHRAPLVAGAADLGHLRRLPQRPGRPHPHLSPLGAAGDRLRRAGPRVLRRPTTPTPCTARTGGCGPAVGVPDDSHPLVRAYHRLLVWDITAHTPLTRVPEAVLNPVLGKSLVVYVRKHAGVARCDRLTRRCRESPTPRRGSRPSSCPTA